uniref:RING-type domain-containing protein n=1 Tax=Trichuris muris TaxID=70415 RepID=A0A5S6QPL5_TRIMR
MPKCPYCRAPLPHEVPCQSYQSAAQLARELRGEKSDGTPTVNERDSTIPNPPNALRVVTDSAFIRRPVVPRFVSAGLNGSACSDPTHQMRLNKMSVACQTDDFVLGKRSCNETSNPPAASTLVLRNDGSADSGCGTVVEDVLRLQINNVKNMTETIKGPAKIVNGVPWKIMVMPRQHTVAKKGNQKCLGFFLQCCPDSYSDSWSCQASAELRMISQRPSVSDFVRKTTHEYTAKENDWGYSCFMTWADVLDENQGYLKDGGITLAVLVKAETPKGILSHEAFVKKIEDYIRLADLQSSRGLIDKAIEVNMSAAKFCKDKDLEVRGRLETQRMSLIRLKLHQSIERIENVAHQNQNGDCHTLNSLRHALVGNMGCTKNGHHKMLKEKTAAALRNVHHNCAFYKDSCNNMRHVKKAFTPALKLRGGEAADCKEYNSQENEVAPEKVNQDNSAPNANGNGAITEEIMPVRELIDDMLTAVTKCDPCQAGGVEVLSEEEAEEEENKAAAAEQDRYISSGSDGYDEVELEVCDRCLVERLEKMSSELPDGSVETTDACCQTEVAENNAANDGCIDKSATRQAPLGATATPEMKRYPPVKLKRNQLLPGLPERAKSAEQHQHPQVQAEQAETVREVKRPVLNSSDNSMCEKDVRQALHSRLTPSDMMEIIKEDIRNKSSKIESSLEKMTAIGQDAVSVGARIRAKGAEGVKKAAAILNLRQAQDEESPLAKAEKAARRPEIRLPGTEPRVKDAGVEQVEQRLKHQKVVNEPGRRKKVSPPIRKANFQTSEPDLVQELKRCRPALLSDNVIKEAREFFTQDDEVLVNCGKVVCGRDGRQVAETVKRVAKQMREMQRQAEYCRNELSEQCKRHFREEHRLNKLNKHLQASLDSANEKLEKANQQLKERRTEMKKLEKRVKAENSSASENALLSRKMESLESELRELRSKHEEERRKFTEENRRLNELKVAMQKEMNYANAEIERLQNALDDKSSAITKLEKEKARERTNAQASIKEATERARRAEVTILELRLEYGLKLLLRAHEDCQSHLSQFDEIAKKHGSIICPADMKALASFQQEWMKVKATIADMMQKSKAEFQQQIDAVRSGKLLSSLPHLEIPKPPPQPALPRICIGKNAAQRQVVPPIGATAVSRPSSSVTVGGGKSPGASSTGSSSPSKPEVRPLVVNEITPNVSSSYAAAAIADRAAGTMYVSSQSVSSANAQGSRNWSDPLNIQQQLFDGKAFGTMFDSFGGSSGNCSSPSTNNWGWANSRPSDVCSPVQALNEYSPTSSCTRAPSGERSECSPCTVATYDGGDKSLPMNADPLVAKVLANFPTLSMADVQQLLEELRVMQVSKSLKGMSSEAMLSGLANLIIAKRSQQQNSAKGRVEKTNGGAVTKDGCVLCKQSFRANNSVLALACGHKFHSGCINKWMAEKRCCPVCTSFNLSQEEYPALA